LARSAVRSSVPNCLRKLANDPAVASIHWDRETAEDEPLAASARERATDLGIDGAGVGVMIIDSGITGGT
jgi:hypothetical protein